MCVYPRSINARSTNKGLAVPHMTPLLNVIFYEFVRPIICLFYRFAILYLNVNFFHAGQENFSFRECRIYL